MSATPRAPIAVKGATLCLEAVLNGKVQSGVRVLRLLEDGESGVPLFTDVLDLVREPARRRMVDALPEETRAEALELAIEMANRILEARGRTVESKATAEDSEHFEELEPWANPVDGAQLLDDVERALARFLVLPPGASTAITLWLAHTYAPDVTDVTPYLLIRSPVRECGKTTLLEILEHLAFRPMLTGAMTAAALYRAIDKWNPTILFDELDTRLRGDSGETLRGILNSGFQKGAKAILCHGDQNEPRSFATYCPKALAGIGRPWDTVESRSIPIRMERASRKERQALQKIRSGRICAELQPLRMMLRRWVSDVREVLQEADPIVPESLSARQADMWRTLLPIADAAGGKWPELARKHAVTLHGGAGDETDRGLLLLEDVHDLFARAAASKGCAVTQLPSARIVAELEKMEHRPWPEHHAGKPISVRAVARLLARFEVKPKLLREGKDTYRGYELAHLEPVFQKYLTTSPEGSGAELSVTTVTYSPDGGESTSSTGCNGVTDNHAALAPDDLFEALEERRAIIEEGSLAIDRTDDGRHILNAEEEAAYLAALQGGA